jgi:hypothetical protein
MSIDEYLQIERERGNILSGGGYVFPSINHNVFLLRMHNVIPGLHQKQNQLPLNSLQSTLRWMEREKVRRRQKRKG